MLENLKDELRAVWHEKRPALRRAAVQARVAVRHGWAILRPPLLATLQVIAALLLLFEEWGWQPLVRGLERLARFRLWARLEQAIAALPPYGALAVFLVPSGVLFPVKVIALYLMAGGHVISATMLFLGAKVASTALIARVFQLTRPALMQIGWFARGYAIVMPWKEHMFALIRESWAWRYGRVLKAMAKRQVAAAIKAWRPRVLAVIAGLRVRWAGVKPRLIDALIATRARLLAVIGSLRRG